MIWSDKYRPTSVGQMVGNENARAEIVRWLAEWRPGTKPVLLVGPPGIGKTTMAFLLAEQFGYDMVGLNASDVRNKSKINELLEPVLGNLAVTGKPVLIFIDEVDGIHGRSDYGGASALAEILKKKSSVPIILAANDDSADKLKPIKKVVTMIQFRRVPPRLLRAYLEHLLKLEDAKTPSPATKITYGVLVKIINRSKGDIRSMINLAQSYATGFNPATETSDDMLTSEQAVAAFFTAESTAEAFDVLRHMQSDPREKIHAFYSSVITSTNLESDTSAALLGVISDADVLYGRILRTQNWRLLRYLDGILVRMHDVMTAIKKSKLQTSENTKGHADSVVKYSQYNLPWPLLTRIRFDGAKIRTLAADMRHILHVSSSTFGALYMPYMLFCLKNGLLAMPDPKEDEHAEILAKEVQRLAK